MSTVKQWTAWAALLLLMSMPVFGEPLRIEITEGVSSALPIAIVPFAGAAQAPGAPVHSIVDADLSRSGRFDTLPTGEMPQQPSSLDQVNFAAWRTTGVTYAAVGQVIPPGQQQLHDPFPDRRCAARAAVGGLSGPRLGG